MKAHCQHCGWPASTYQQQLGAGGLLRLGNFPGYLPPTAPNIGTALAGLTALAGPFVHSGRHIGRLDALYYEAGRGPARLLRRRGMAGGVK